MGNITSLAAIPPTLALYGGAALLGGIIGWLAQQNNYINLQNQGMAFSHPEMYDENGNLIPDEIVAVRFENDNSEEDDDED